MHKRAVAVLLGSISLCAASADAAAIFNFTNNLIGNEPAAFIAPGSQPLHFISSIPSPAELDVFGRRFTLGGSLVSSTLHQNLQGLGVYSADGDDVEVDASSIVEMIVFAFNQPVLLHSVVFGRVGLADAFGLYIDGSLTPALEQAIPGGNAGDTAFSTVLVGDLPGQIFAFTASRASGATDDFKIAGVVAVPEPSTLALVASAFVGALGVVRRRRTSVDFSTLDRASGALCEAA